MIANEVAKTAGVSANVVRYYSRIGLLNPTRNPDNGYREYTPQDVIRVRFIRKAKWLGFTLKDVKVILEEADSGKSPCGEVRRIIAEKGSGEPTTPGASPGNSGADGEGDGILGVAIR